MRIAIISTVLLLALAACETREHTDAELEAVKRAKEVARQANSHTVMTPTEDFGITECDDYLRQMSDCINSKVPADDQPGLRFQLESQQRKWATMARDPAQRDTLPAECKAATDLARQATANYGCSF